MLSTHEIAHILAPFGITYARKTADYGITSHDMYMEFPPIEEVEIPYCDTKRKMLRYKPIASYTTEGFNYPIFEQYPHEDRWKTFAYSFTEIDRIYGDVNMGLEIDYFIRNGVMALANPDREELNDSIDGVKKTMLIELAKFSKRTSDNPCMLEELRQLHKHGTDDEIYKSINLIDFWKIDHPVIRRLSESVRHPSIDDKREALAQIILGPTTVVLPPPHRLKVLEAREQRNRRLDANLK